MTDWGALRDAYGTAESVPELLAAAERSGESFGSAWDDLWSRLCHQGTVYSASYAALPLLADICTRQPPRGYLAGLHLASSIVASTDGPDDPAAVRHRYASEISRLGEVAAVCLPLADSDTEFIHGLEALAAFEDAGPWQRTLNYLADGEAPLRCASCGEDLLLEIDELPAHVISWDAGRGTRPVVPGDPDPGSPEQRLLSLAARHGRPAVAERLRSYFGTSTCPRCGTTIAVRDCFA